MTLSASSIVAGSVSLETRTENVSRLALILLYPETLGIAAKGKAVDRDEGVLTQNLSAHRPISKEIASLLTKMLNRGTRREA
jgi:hypothetical protein